MCFVELGTSHGHVVDKMWWQTIAVVISRMVVMMMTHGNDTATCSAVMMRSPAVV